MLLTTAMLLLSTMDSKTLTFKELGGRVTHRILWHHPKEEALTPPKGNFSILDVS